MKIWTRISAVMAVATLAVGLLVACGNDETEPGVANPASEYCESIGGEVLLDEGLCRLPDGTEVDEWELYRDRDAGTAEPVPTATVTLYLSRDGEDCEAVEAVVREVTGPVAPAMVLDELLAGPTDEERDAGFGSWFSSATAGMLQSVEIDDGVAMVSFASELPQVIPGASSSCGSANLLAQLDATLTELPEIDRAVYALDGDVDAFYEWLQMVSPAS